MEKRKTIQQWHATLCRQRIIRHQTGHRQTARLQTTFILKHDPRRDGAHRHPRESAISSGHSKQRHGASPHHSNRGTVSQHTAHYVESINISNNIKRKLPKPETQKYPKYKSTDSIYRLSPYSIHRGRSFSRSLCLRRRHWSLVVRRSSIGNHHHRSPRIFDHRRPRSPLTNRCYEHTSSTPTTTRCC